MDVGRLSRERHPAEGPRALAEEGPDVGRDEARIRERVGDAAFLRLRAQVVAVVEDVGAAPAKLEHRAHVLRHAVACLPNVLVGIAGT